MALESVGPDDIERIMRAPLAFRQGETHTLSDRLKALVALPEIRVVSFDCFDTLVKRATHRPINVFDQIGEALRERSMLPSYVDNARFRDWRVRAELEARAKLGSSGSQEVNLSQIYNELEKLAGGAISVKDFIKCELEVEKSSMFLNSDMIAIADYARKLGKSVIVVSDTYYTSGELQFITGLGGIGKIDRFYVSSEFGTGKGGGLFEIVLKREDVLPYEVLHIGDNFAADIERPIQHGIRVCLAPNGSGEFWRVITQELMLPTLERRYWEASGIGKWHGSLTAIRSLRPLLDEPKAELTYYSFGFEILGPVIFGYLKWVESVVSQIDNPLVLGLLREGGFLASLYRIVAPQANVRLMALSRRTMNQMELREPTVQTLKALLSVRKGENVGDFLPKIGLTIHDLPEKMRQTSIGVDSASDEIIDYILSNKKLVGRIKEFAGDVAEQFAAYVQRAEDGKTYSNVVFLDLGWAASIQRKIDKHPIFQGKQLLGLYLALNNLAFASLESINVAGYLVNGFAGGEVEDLLLRYVEILEQVCTPEIGSTIGYSKGFSLHGQPTTNSQQLQQIAMVQAGMIDFVTRANEAYPSTDVNALREAVLRILTRFTFSPTALEKDMFRNWSHDDSIIDAHDPMTPEYLDDIEPYMTATQTLEGRFLYWYWPQGAKTFGQNNPDLLNILPFGVQAIRSRNEQEPFAVLRAVCGAAQEQVQATPRLNSQGRLYVEFPVVAGSGTMHVDIAELNGFFIFEEVYFYVNASGERNIRRGSTSAIQIIDAEYNTLIANYDGRMITGSAAKNILLRLDLPSFPGEVIEAVSFCCVGAIQRAPKSEIEIPDFVLHLDTFASAPEFDAPNLEEGLVVSGHMVFEGWAFDSRRLCRADAIMLQVEFVDGEAENIPSVAYHGERRHRPDVAKHLKKLIDFDVGFRFAVPVSDLNRRAFKLYLKLQLDGAWIVKPMIEQRILLVNAGRFYALG